MCSSILKHIEDYTERLEFKFYVDLYYEDKVHKWDFLSELDNERVAAYFELKGSASQLEQARYLDLENPAHLELLEKKPRHGQILAFYKKLCPNDPLLYGKIRTLHAGFRFDEKPDAVLPCGQDLLAKIEKDRREVDQANCGPSIKAIFFQLAELLKADTIDELQKFATNN